MRKVLAILVGLAVLAKAQAANKTQYVGSVMIVTSGVAAARSGAVVIGKDDIFVDGTSVKNMGGNGNAGPMIWSDPGKSITNNSASIVGYTNSTSGAVVDVGGVTYIYIPTNNPAAGGGGGIGGSITNTFGAAGTVTVTIPQ